MDRRTRQCTNIHESQFGFISGRSTTDAIFILKQTIEKHGAGQKNIRVTFIDLEKAYWILRYIHTFYISGAVTTSRTCGYTPVYMYAFAQPVNRTYIQAIVVSTR